MLIKMPRRTKIILLIAVVLVGAVVGTNWYVLNHDAPMQAVQAQSVALGYPVDDQEPVGGGYSSRFLSYTAYGRFRSRSRPDSGVIHVELRKATPFHAWQLREYRIQDEDRPAADPDTASR